MISRNTSERVDEKTGHAIHIKGIVIAVSGFTSRQHLFEILLLIIQFHQLLELFRKLGGVHHFDSVISCSNDVYVDEKFYFIEWKNRMPDEIR